MIDAVKYPALHHAITCQLDVWPNHKAFLDKSFAKRDDDLLATSEQIAGLIVRLADHAGSLEQLCRDYRFLCEDIVLPEEEHFRRHGRYRLSTFKDAFEQVYSNRAFMDRYMNGLLLSDIFWENHARSMDAFARQYLSRLPKGACHLEIGPGHGMLMYLAARQPDIGRLEAWDVSETSVNHTRRSLETMAVTRPSELRCQNLFEATGNAALRGRYDSVVVSEVLEHLEDPLAALAVINDLLKPGGTVWVNVPANSPVPDHLYLIDVPEQAAALVADAGFEVTYAQYFPMTGTTLDKAKRLRLTVSCCVIGRRPA